MTFLEKNQIAFQRISTHDLKFSIAEDVKFNLSLSPEEVAAVISEVLNRRIDHRFCVFVIPGIFDIILIKKDLIIDKIKKSFDNSKKKYLLDGIIEMQGFGSELKIAIARAVLSQYGLPFTQDCFSSEEALG